MKCIKLRLYFLSLILGLCAMSLVPRAGHTEQANEFSLLCSTPIFTAATGSSIDSSHDRERCNRLRDSFNKYLREQGFKEFFVQYDIVHEEKSIDLIVSRSMEKKLPIGVWIGGAQFLHDIALEKELVAETARISRQEWDGQAITVSITASTNNYKLSYMFISWIREARIPDLITSGG